MDAERYARMKELFLEAVALPPDQRRGFLETSCRDDQAMRRHVESLLAHHLEPDSADHDKGEPSGV